MVIAKPLRLFFSYAHRDERWRDELQAHLSVLQHAGVITPWHDRNVTAGREWESQIDANLESAQVILLLVSAAFLASAYCTSREMRRAIERHLAGEARVIPIIVREVDWHDMPIAEDMKLGDLQALPKDEKAVTNWSNRDRAWSNVSRGIRDAVDELVSGVALNSVNAVVITAPASSLALTASTRTAGNVAPAEVALQERLEPRLDIMFDPTDRTCRQTYEIREGPAPGDHEVIRLKVTNLSDATTIENVQVWIDESDPDEALFEHREHLEVMRGTTNRGSNVNPGEPFYPQLLNIYRPVDGSRPIVVVDYWNRRSVRWLTRHLPPGQWLLTIKVTSRNSVPVRRRFSLSILESPFGQVAISQVE
jgi:hypothetical protein